MGRKASEVDPGAPCRYFYRCWNGTSYHSFMTSNAPPDTNPTPPPIAVVAALGIFSLIGIIATILALSAYRLLWFAVIGAAVVPLGLSWLVPKQSSRRSRAESRAP